MKTTSITAHRAGGHLGPENSLTALRRATAIGVPWAEIDVQLSLDGAVVVFHDEHVKGGVTGSSKKVSDCTLAELRRLGGDSREPIATLEECIAVVRGRTQLNIEMKDYGRSEALPARVISVLREKDFVAGAKVCSFSASLVNSARAIEPPLAVGYVLETVADFSCLRDVAFVSVNHEAVTAGFVRSAHERKIEVHAWTVNTRPAMLRLLALGVDNLITDEPTLAKEAIAQFNRKGWLARRLLRW
jgi:glycerophosphoryl diester phosphodiesterase